MSCGTEPYPPSAIRKNCQPSHCSQDCSVDPVPGESCRLRTVSIAYATRAAAQTMAAATNERRQDGSAVAATSGGAFAKVGTAADVGPAEEVGRVKEWRPVTGGTIRTDSARWRRQRRGAREAPAPAAAGTKLPGGGGGAARPPH